MALPSNGPGLLLAPDAPDGSGRSKLSESPHSELPPIDTSGDGPQQMVETLHCQRAAEEFEAMLRCLRLHGMSPVEAHASPGGFAFRIAEDAEPVSPVTPGTGVHEPPSPSAAPEIPFRAGDGDGAP
jgi:hypothetical protein